MNQHPAHSDPRVIYLVRHENFTGPYTRAELRRYWGLGRMQAQDYVWVEGMKECVRLASFLSMKSLGSHRMESETFAG